MPHNQTSKMTIPLSLADVEDAVREGTYVAVGLGVLGFQKAQVRRRELAKQIQAQTDKATEQLSGAGINVNDQFDMVRSQLNDVGENFSVQVGAAKDQVADIAKAVDRRLEPARQQLQNGADEIERRLPNGAKDVFHSARNVADTPIAVLRNAIGLG